jgi:hypothetical protein
VDAAWWFRRRDGQITLAMDKHAGRMPAEVAERHPDDIRWLLALNLLDGTRRVIEEASSGRPEAASARADRRSYGVAATTEYEVRLIARSLKEATASRPTSGTRPTFSQLSLH